MFCPSIVRVIQIYIPLLLTVTDFSFVLLSVKLITHQTKCVQICSCCLNVKKNVFNQIEFSCQWKLFQTCSFFMWFYEPEQCFYFLGYLSFYFEKPSKESTYSVYFADVFVAYFPRVHDFLVFLLNTQNIEMRKWIALK